MTAQADIVVYDTKGNLTLIVEVKNKLGTDSEWAAKMRQNLLAYGLLLDAQYFLIALPDRFYLWKGKALPELEKPHYEVDSSTILKPYFARAGVSPENLSEAGLELLILSWLKDLILTGETINIPKESDQWIIESEIIEALKHGHIDLEIVT
jgi:hypothetical protein